MAGNHKKPHPIRRERAEIRRERIDALELKDLSPEETAVIDNWIEADQDGNPERKLQFAKEWRQLGRRVKDFDAVVNLRKRAKVAEETGTTPEQVETGLTLKPTDSRSLLHAEVKRDVDDKLEMLEELRLADFDILDLTTPGERRILALQTIGTKETLAWAKALSANPNDGGATRAVEEFKKSLEDAEKIQRALAKQNLEYSGQAVTEAAKALGFDNIVDNLSHPRRDPVSWAMTVGALAGAAFIIGKIGKKLWNKDITGAFGWAAGGAAVVGLGFGLNELIKNSTEKGTDVLRGNVMDTSESNPQLDHIKALLRRETGGNERALQAVMHLREVKLKHLLDLYVSASGENGYGREEIDPVRLFDADSGIDKSTADSLQPAGTYQGVKALLVLSYERLYKNEDQKISDSEKAHKATALLKRDFNDRFKLENLMAQILLDSKPKRADATGRSVERVSTAEDAEKAKHAENWFKKFSDKEVYVNYFDGIAYINGYPCRVTQSDDNGLKFRGVELSDETSVELNDSTSAEDGKQKLEKFYKGIKTKVEEALKQAGVAATAGTENALEFIEGSQQWEIPMVGAERFSEFLGDRAKEIKAIVQFNRDGEVEIHSSEDFDTEGETLSEALEETVKAEILTNVKEQLPHTIGGAKLDDLEVSELPDANSEGSKVTLTWGDGAYNAIVEFTDGKVKSVTMENVGTSTKLVNHINEYSQSAALELVESRLGTTWDRLTNELARKYNKEAYISDDLDPTDHNMRAARRKVDAYLEQVAAKVGFELAEKLSASPGMTRSKWNETKLIVVKGYEDDVKSKSIHDLEHTYFSPEEVKAGLDTQDTRWQALDAIPQMPEKVEATHREMDSLAQKLYNLEWHGGFLTSSLRLQLDDWLHAQKDSVRAELNSSPSKNPSEILTKFESDIRQLLAANSRSPQRVISKLTESELTDDRWNDSVQEIGTMLSSIFEFTSYGLFDDPELRHQLLRDFVDSKINRGSVEVTTKSGKRAATVEEIETYTNYYMSQLRQLMKQGSKNFYASYIEGVQKETLTQTKVEKLQPILNQIPDFVSWQQQWSAAPVKKKPDFEGRPIRELDLNIKLKEAEMHEKADVYNWALDAYDQAIDPQVDKWFQLDGSWPDFFRAHFEERLRAIQHNPDHKTPEEFQKVAQKLIEYANVEAAFYRQLIDAEISIGEGSEKLPLFSILGPIGYYLGASHPAAVAALSLGPVAVEYGMKQYTGNPEYQIPLNVSMNAGSETAFAIRNLVDTAFKTHFKSGNIKDYRTALESGFKAKIREIKEIDDTNFSVGGFNLQGGDPIQWSGNIH